MLKLTKVPNQIIDNIKLCWNNLNKEKTETNPDLYKFRKCTEVFCQYQVSNNKFYDKLTRHFEIFGVPCLEYYVMEPAHLASPHIDRGRDFAINFPVKIPYADTDAFFGKKHNLTYYTEDPNRKYTWKIDENVSMNKPFFALYEEEKFISHNFNTGFPVLFKPSIPHGGYNRSNKTRVLFSLSFGPSLKYNEGVNITKKLGWM